MTVLKQERELLGILNFIDQQGCGFSLNLGRQIRIRDFGIPERCLSVYCKRTVPAPSKPLDKKMLLL